MAMAQDAMAERGAYVHVECSSAEMCNAQCSGPQPVHSGGGVRGRGGWAGAWMNWGLGVGGDGRWAEAEAEAGAFL
jgi:hypothetical protein